MATLFAPPQRRWAAVLDPALALSPHGLYLTLHLGQVLDLWIVRELWHILDNTHFYLEQPQAIFSGPSPWKPAQMLRALQDWELARSTTNFAAYGLFWLGDGVSASQLPEGKTTQLIRQTELLAEALENRKEDQALNSGVRDTLALAAALESALILTVQPEPDQPPEICCTLERWGVPCTQMQPSNPLVRLEGDKVQQFFVQAGLTKLLWTGVRLAVVQLIVPGVPMPAPDLDDLLLSLAPPPIADPWQEARSFWYSLTW